MKKRKRNGIKFSKDGTPSDGFQNRFAVLIECARKAGLNAHPGISPYIVADALSHTLGVHPEGETKRERFDWLITYLIDRYEIRREPERPRATARGDRIRDFYKSWEWRRTRMKALKQHGARCQCCGATAKDHDIAGNPVRIVVDHIKPIRKYWELRLDVENLQVLCDECNMGKGSWDESDWRIDEAIDAQLRYET